MHDKVIMTSELIPSTAGVCATAAHDSEPCSMNHRKGNGSNQIPGLDRLGKQISPRLTQSTPFPAAPLTMKHHAAGAVQFDQKLGQNSDAARRLGAHSQWE